MLPYNAVRKTYVEHMDTGAKFLDGFMGEKSIPGS
jgi:hypothetical protein